MVDEAVKSSQLKLYILYHGLFIIAIAFIKVTKFLQQTEPTKFKSIP